MKQLRFILLGLTLLLAASAIAQSDFKPGYVIREKGDTLWGQIDYRGSTLMATRCRFIPKGSEEYIDYSPMDIYGYRFTDGKFFISKEVEGVRYFLEYLVEGKVHFYFLRTLKDDDRYYIENDSLGIRRLPYEEGVRNFEGKDYFYRSKTHIGLLKCYMKDAPELGNRINQIEKFEAKNLIDLDREYHRIICEGDRCIVYQKKLPPFKVIIEPMVGFSKYNWSANSIGIENKYLCGGVMANFWSPRTNEKLYVRIGYRYVQLQVIDEAKAEFKSMGFNLTDNQTTIPLQLEYIYPKGRVRPKAAVGLSLYNSLEYIAPSFMAGINVSINKRVGVSLNYDIDFMHSENLVLLPKKMLSNTFTGGVLVTLGKLNY